jgi:hypothetical protein
MQRLIRTPTEVVSFAPLWFAIPLFTIFYSNSSSCGVNVCVAGTPLTPADSNRPILKLHAGVNLRAVLRSGRSLVHMTKIATFILVLAAMASAQETSAPATPPQGGQRGEMRRMQFNGTAGTIESIKGDTVTLKGLDGKETTVKMSDKTQFRKDQKDAKLADFKAGDIIVVMGEQNPDGSWTAQNVRSRGDLMMQMRNGAGNATGAPAGAANMMQALSEGWGKQFIAGTVKEINGTKLTIEGPEQRVATIEVDENTSFRKMGGAPGGESVTLLDIKQGYTVIGRGALNKDGVFVPTVLNVSEKGMGGGQIFMSTPQKPQQ